MLATIEIKNLLLIDQLKIHFGNELNIITGETGAGKSIILDMLQFACGGKFKPEWVRTKGQEAWVLVLFSLTKDSPINEILAINAIPSEEDEVIFKRVIGKDLKVRNYINDTIVSQSLIKELGVALLEVHGQHDQSGLIEVKNHLTYVDEFAKNNSELAEIAALVVEYSSQTAVLQQLRTKASVLSKEKDYLSHILKEFEKLAPREGEEDELCEARKNIMSQVANQELYSQTLKELDLENFIHKAISAQKRLAKLPDEESEVIEVLDQITELAANLETQLEGKVSHQNSENSIDKIEERLFAIRGLARKLGVNSNELFTKHHELKSQSAELETLESEIEKLEKYQAELNVQYFTLAQNLSAKRQKAAKELEKRIIHELKYLKMEKTRFEIAFTKKDKITNHGIDEIEFLISPNPGMPLASLSETASGGELSRICLAIKIALGASDASYKTVIFDEIDTGISGQTALAIGDRLKEYSKLTQVIVVTHLPQVASKGQMHFVVKKTVEGNKTNLEVTELSEEERELEIARMFFGNNITDDARKAAKELLSM